MPESCYSCVANVHYMTECGVTRKRLELERYTNRPGWCPLKTLPEENEFLKRRIVMDKVVFDIHKLIDESMNKKDRYVTIYFGENGTSVSVYPLIDEESDDE